MSKIYLNEGFVIAKLYNRRIKIRKEEDGLLRITLVRLLPTEIVNLNPVCKSCCNVNTRLNRVIITKSILLTEEAAGVIGEIITLMKIGLI